MTELLLKTLGIRANEAGDLARTTVELHGLHPGYLLLGAVLLGLLVWFMYRRAAEDLPRWRQVSLTVLRALFLVLILGLLLRPVLKVTFESGIRRTVLLLFDTSASMSEIRDQRSTEPDLKRAALVAGELDPTKGLEQELPTASAGIREVPRVELVKSALKNPKLALLPALAKDFDLAAYSFDRSLAEVPGASFTAAIDEKGQVVGGGAPALKLDWVDRLRATGEGSAVGDAVRDVISRKRGQALAGVVLVTDGANNAGTQPLDAAALAKQDGVPLFVYGVGITSPRDVIVSTILAQEVAFAKDEVPVTVRVRTMGMAGQSAMLTVQMGSEKAEKNVEFNADGETLVGVSLTPKDPGEFEITASVEPRADEVMKENNVAQAQRIRVIDGKMKVLMVEQTPRWEFKYIQAALMRDRRIDFKCVLLEGDEDLSDQTDSPYLREFPKKKEDLFKYDLLIIGDVPPATFTPQQTEAIAEFVSKFGGAMVMLAGKRHAPSAFRGSMIEKMLPVELESSDLSNPATANKPVKVELTPSGKSQPMLRLAPSEPESAALWGRMPPLFWIAKVARARPAADVLVVDPDPAKSTRYGKMPVVAKQQYGLGQVLYIGTDNLWRWRKNVGDRFHSALWGQIAQHLALPHLLGASKRTQLSSDQRNYTTGSKVTVIARLYSESFDPMTDPAVRATYVETSNGSAPRELILRQVPNHPALYKGELVAPGAGLYRVSVDHDKGAQLEFAVADPKRELTESAMNEKLLQQMAEASGGQFYREETLYRLPGAMPGKQERKQTTMEAELWSSPIYFALLMLVVTCEWVLRKMSQLK